MYCSSTVPPQHFCQCLSFIVIRVLLGCLFFFPHRVFSNFPKKLQAFLEYPINLLPLDFFEYYDSCHRATKKRKKKTKQKSDRKNKNITYQSLQPQHKQSNIHYGPTSIVFQLPIFCFFQTNKQYNTKYNPKTQGNQILICNFPKNVGAGKQLQHLQIYHTCCHARNIYFSNYCH